MLFGEHAVVYGNAALACPLPVTLRVAVEAGAGTWRAPAWHLALHLDAVDKPAQALRTLLDHLDVPWRDLAFTLEGELPPGAGLGSSAALSIATARAALAYLGRPASRSDVEEATLAAERVFHGNPSGLDHTVILHEQAILFRRGTPAYVERLRIAEPLPIVVAQVQHGADTGKMVAGVAARRQRYPDVMDPLLRAMEALIPEARRGLEQGDLALLGELATVNHAFLSALGVSTPALDAACHMARGAGATGAKLTGAGGGGCIFAFCPAEKQAAVEEALRVMCLEVFSTMIPSQDP